MQDTVSRPAPASSPAIAVKGIDHVTLVVDDLERSRQFYCGVLGMRSIERPSFDFAGSWFAAGNTQVHLILSHPECARSGYPNATAQTMAGRVHHFAFEVDDVYSATEQLRQHSVPIMGGPCRRPDGCIQLWFYDPDGHVVEIFHHAASCAPPVGTASTGECHT